MVRKFKEKECGLCSLVYAPTSPKQKYCVLCKEKATKIEQSKRDKVRNRKNHSKVYSIECPSCKILFETYDSKKKYCGLKKCEEFRVRSKNKISHERRGKQYMIEKGIKYYKNNHEKCLLGKTTFHQFRDNGGVRGVRCAICYQQNNYVSKLEQLIRDFIEENFPKLKVIYNDRSILKPQELDFYFPDNNLAIEVCGLYWHSELKSGKKRSYHYDKMIKCYGNDIRLITIFEDELDDQKEIVFSRIRQALGKPKRRVFARKCTVKEIESKVANAFYKLNHIQGVSTALVRYGLYFEEELLCVGSLGKIGRKHTSSEDTIELKRFCTLPSISVVGGVGKIFKRMKMFAKENGYTIIKSYCDMRYANIFKPVYEVLGFKLTYFTKYTPHYFRQQKRYRNYSLRKTPEERLTGKTEWQLRQEQGYGRIWDCGHRTYEYIIN